MSKSSNNSNNVVRTSRKALNDLQYSPNGKDIVGLSPRKANQLNIKKGLFDLSTTNSFKSKDFRKRTSISLPDICSSAASSCNSISFNNSFNKSEASTPSKPCFTPTKHGKRNNISIILEEKENPNLISSLYSDKYSKEKKAEEKDSSTNKNVSKSSDGKREDEKKKTFKEIAIQCNKLDEDMLFADTVENTPYWKLMTHRILKSLQETDVENIAIGKLLDELNDKNDILRNKNESLNKLLNEYDEIRKIMLESTQNDEEIEDSGYDA